MLSSMIHNMVVLVTLLLLACGTTAIVLAFTAHLLVYPMMLLGPVALMADGVNGKAASEPTS